MNVSDEIYPHFGAKLREVREASGLTQADLGHRVRLSRSSIANIEAGRQAVYLHQAIILTDALGQALSSFIPAPGGGRPTSKKEENRIQKIIDDSDEYVADATP